MCQLCFRFSKYLSSFLAPVDIIFCDFLSQVLAKGKSKLNKNKPAIRNNIEPGRTKNTVPIKTPKAPKVMRTGLLSIK